MRWNKYWLIMVLCLAPWAAQAADESRVVKVLPFFLDREGRTGLSPSLFDRDAYQAQLRKNPAQRLALRFDIQWRAAAYDDLKIRLELRGLKDGTATERLLEEPARKGNWLGNWTAPMLTGEDYQNFGEVTSWRVTLWRGTEQLAEQKSFLWREPAIPSLK